MVSFTLMSDTVTMPFGDSFGKVPYILFLWDRSYKRLAPTLC